MDFETIPIWAKLLAALLSLTGLYRFGVFIWESRKFEGSTKSELMERLNQLMEYGAISQPHPESTPTHDEYEPCRLALEIISKGWRSNFFNKKLFIDTHWDTFSSIYVLWEKDTRVISDSPDKNRPIVKTYLTKNIKQTYKEMREYHE